jgi:hypothetical protein
LYRYNTDIERLDALAAMHVNLAHAAALLREHGLVKSAIDTATEALDAVDKLELGGVNVNASGDGDGAGGDAATDGGAGEAAAGGGGVAGDSSATYKRTTRQELRLELKRIGGNPVQVRESS